MNENVKAFLTAVREDAEWLETCKGITDREEAVAVAVAKAAEMGLSLEAADFSAVDELSEDELATVAGGELCSCAIGGGGTSDYDGDEPCACVIIGAADDMICMVLGFE